MTVRALPHLRFKDPETQKAYDAVREALQEGNGERGDPNNRWLTVADLDGTITQRINVVASEGGGGGGGSATQASVLLTSSNPAPAANAVFVLTATVVGNNPSGTVTFKQDGATIESPVSVNNGAATINRSLAKGTYQFEATYSGDSNNTAALSAVLVLEVGKVIGDGQDPPAPISLTTTPDAWAIRLTWEQPANMPEDYDVTEIWCRNATSGDKLLAGSLRGNQFVFSGLDDHLLETGETWYFWVRNKDIEERYSGYYPNNDVGVSGQALPSPDTLINGQVIDIVNGPLYSWLGKVIQLLRGPTDVPDSVAARLKAQDDKLVAMINEVTVSGNGTLDPAKIWYFDANAENWTGSNVTVSWASGAITAEATANNGELISPVFATSIDGSKYSAIRVRSQQLAGGEWVKGVKFKTSGGTWHSYTPAVPPLNGPEYAESGYSDTDWDLSEVANWTGNTIVQMAFVLEESGQEIKFDWVAVGRIAPGASWESVEAVRVSSNRVIRKPYTDFTPNFGPPNPYNGVALRVDDLWYDTATAEYDANNLLLKGGNRPHAWTGSAWTALNDSRIIHSEAELWNIAKAQAGPNGSAAYRISGISTKANDAYTLAGTKASITDVENAFAGNQASLSSRLTYIESSTSEGTAAAIADFQKAAIGYATVATAHTYLGVTYRVGDIFEGNGSTIIYPVLTYPDAEYPQYAATDRKTVIDSVGVTRWNTIVGMTNPAAVKWNTGLPLAKAVKQVSVTPAAFCVVNGELDPTKTTESACVNAGGIWTPAGSPLGLEQQFQALQKADGELYAQYSVKIDNQGWVSGFGLSSTPSRDGSPFSEFGVRADRFFLAAPNTPKTLPQKLKYQGSGGSSNVVVTRFNDVPNNRKLAYFVCADSSQFVPDQWATLSGISPAGWNTSFVISHKSGNTVYLELDDALYNSLGSNGLASAYGVPNTDSTATAQSANIPFIVLTSGRSINGVTYQPGVYATQAYIKKLSVTNALIADAAITSAKIAQSIQSTNYSPGAKTGWIINKDGNVEFNNGVWRGTLQSDPFVQGSTGWQLQADGDAEFNSVIVRNPSKNISNGSMIRMRVWGGQGTDTLNVPNNTSDPYTIWSSSYAFLHEPGSLITVIATVQFECPTTTTTIHLEASDGTNTATKVLFDRYGTSNPGLGARFFNGVTMFLLYVPNSRVGTIRLKVRHIAGSPANYRDITLHTQEMYA